MDTLLILCYYESFDENKIKHQRRSFFVPAHNKLSYTYLSKIIRNITNKKLRQHLSRQTVLRQSICGQNTNPGLYWCNVIIYTISEVCMRLLNIFVVYLARSVGQVFEMELDEKGGRH